MFIRIENEQHVSYCRLEDRSVCSLESIQVNSISILRLSGCIWPCLVIPFFCGVCLTRCKWPQGVRRTWRDWVSYPRAGVVYPTV